MLLNKEKLVCGSEEFLRYVYPDGLTVLCLCPYVLPNRKSQAIVKHPLGVNSPTDWSKKGNGSCGLNIHNTGAHLADYVEGWGPLWTWSTFGFEDITGTIMDFFYIFIYLRICTKQYRSKNNRTQVPY